MDRGAWWATVHGVTKTCTHLSMHAMCKAWTVGYTHWFSKMTQGKQRPMDFWHYKSYRNASIPEDGSEVLWNYLEWANGTQLYLSTSCSNKSINYRFEKKLKKSKLFRSILQVWTLKKKRHNVKTLSQVYSVSYWGLLPKRQPLGVEKLFQSSKGRRSSYMISVKRVRCNQTHILREDGC